MLGLSSWEFQHFLPCVFCRKSPLFPCVTQEEVLREVGDFLRRRRAEVASREANQHHAPNPRPVASPGSRTEEDLRCLRRNGAGRPPASRDLDKSPAAAASQLRSSVRASLESNKHAQSMSDSMRSSLDTAKSTQRYPHPPLSPPLPLSLVLYERTGCGRQCSDISYSICRFAGMADEVLASAELEDFTKEVAACVIQHYWREARAGSRPRPSQIDREENRTIEAASESGTASPRQHGSGHCSPSRPIAQAPEKYSPDQQPPSPPAVHHQGSTSPQGSELGSSVCRDLNPILEGGEAVQVRLNPLQEMGEGEGGGEGCITA